MSCPARRGRRRALALLLGLVPFAAGELALRARGFTYPRIEIPLVIWDSERDVELARSDGMHRSDEGQMWVPREGAPVLWGEGERVSPHGFRGRDPDPRAEPRVLTLGDSSTFGYGLPAAQAYSALLEEGLRSALGTGGGSVQVLNGGVVGSTIVQGLARYRAVRRAWRPEVVVEAFGAINEHFPTRDLPDVQKIDWLQRHGSFAWRAWRLVRNEWRLVGLGAWLRDELHGGREARFLSFVQEERDKRLALRDYAALDDYPRRVSAADFRQCLMELREAVQGDGGRLVLVQMPRRAEVETRLPPVLDYDAALAAFVAETGVPCVDVRTPFRERVAAGVPEEDLLLDSVHPTAAGHRILAELLLPEVVHALQTGAR